MSSLSRLLASRFYFCFLSMPTKFGTVDILDGAISHLFSIEVWRLVCCFYNTVSARLEIDVWMHIVCAFGSTLWSTVLHSWGRILIVRQM